MTVCCLISVIAAAVSAGENKFVYDKNGFDLFGYNIQDFDQIHNDNEKALSSCHIIRVLKKWFWWTRRG